MTRVKAIAAAAGGSLIAVAMLFAPASAETRSKGSRFAAARPVGAYTPAVSDPRLAAALAQRGVSVNRDFRFTPASATERNRAVRVAIRARATTPAEAARSVASTSSASPVSAITPSSYNLGVSLGWRRFALSGDVAQSVRHHLGVGAAVARIDAVAGF